MFFHVFGECVVLIFFAISDVRRFVGVEMMFVSLWKAQSNYVLSFAPLFIAKAVASIEARLGESARDARREIAVYSCRFHHSY